MKDDQSDPSDCGICLVFVENLAVEFQDDVGDRQIVLRRYSHGVQRKRIGTSEYWNRAVYCFVLIGPVATSSHFAILKPPR